MKTFSVVVLLALVIVIVIGTDSAAVSSDYDDSNDNSFGGKTHDFIRYARSAEKYTKVGSKHPLYVFFKGLFKILSKIFSADNVMQTAPDLYQNNT